MTSAPDGVGLTVFSLIRYSRTFSKGIIVVNPTPFFLFIRLKSGLPFLESRGLRTTNNKTTHKLMKHILSSLITAILTVIPAVMSAQSATIGGLNYTLSNTNMTATVGSSTGVTGYVNIPQTVTYEGAEYTVTAIASRAFNYCSGIPSVVIPETVKSIGMSAFASCGKLTEFYILSPDATIKSSILDGSEGVSEIYTVVGHSYKPTDFGKCMGFYYRTIETHKYGFDEAGNILIVDELAEFTDEKPYTATSTSMTETVTYTRHDVKARVWNSLCLPFDCSVPEGVTVEECVEIKSSTVVFAKVGGIKAGQAYLFKSESDGDVTFSAKDVVMKPVIELEADYWNGTEGFIGVLGRTMTDEDFCTRYPNCQVDDDMPGPTIYGMNPNDNEFQIANIKKSDNTIIRCLPFHAFIVLNTSSSATAMRIAHKDNGATGIKRHQCEERATRTAIYSLSGQRMSAPQKGINIINGKKIIIK